MRQLRFTEAKLLKKVDFYNWRDFNLEENKILSTYNIQKREHYHKYEIFYSMGLFYSNILERYVKLKKMIVKLANMVAKLDPADPVRVEITEQLCEKLYESLFFLSRIVI